MKKKRSRQEKIALTPAPLILIIDIAQARNSWMRQEAPTAPAESRALNSGREKHTPLSRASEESIALLLRLSFDRSEISDLLAQLSTESETDSLSLGSQYRRLVQGVREQASAARALDAALALRLEVEARPLRTHSLVTLATLWAQHRDQSGGLLGAAMLWTVARQSKPCWRKLEAVMVEDLNYLAARAFVTHTELPPTELKGKRREVSAHEQAA